MRRQSDPQDWSEGTPDVVRDGQAGWRPRKDDEAVDTRVEAERLADENANLRREVVALREGAARATTDGAGAHAPARTK